MIKVSTTGMAVSLKTDLRFPESGQHGHGSRIIQEVFKAPDVLWFESFKMCDFTNRYEVSQMAIR